MKIKDFLFKFWVLLSGIIIIAVTLGIFVYLFYKGIGVISLEFIFGSPKGIPLGTEGGIFPAIIGSLVSGLLSGLMGGILGLCTAVYLVFYCENEKIRNYILQALQCLAGIPEGSTIIKLVIPNALRYIMTSLGIGVVFAMGATAPVMFTGAVIINKILRNIDACFEKNKITAIIGPSGCGKSTFLKSINRTVEEYGEKNKEKLHETVIKNSKKAGLYDEVKDNLNMQASKLSGGQQQRLVIARCLTVNPEIILLDEPCSALDIKNTAHIEKMLLELKNDYTIIIVTHNLAQAKRIADYVVFMDDGNIIEMGTTDEIFNHPVDHRTQEYIDYMKN